MSKTASDNTANNLKTKIPVIYFEEGNKIIAYSPALDLSTYGKDEEQARKRFEEAASIFFDEIVKMGTVDDVLAELGWRKNRAKQTWQAPTISSCTEALVQIPERA